MEVLLEKSTPTNATLTVKLAKEDYQPKVDKTLKDYSKRVNLKGFRPGKVPTQVIKRMYGKTIVIDEDNAAQHPSIIDARLTVALWEERLQSRHLRVGQPKKIAHRSVSLRRLNHAASGCSMGPDPNLISDLIPAMPLLQFPVIEVFGQDQEIGRASCRERVSSPV